MSTTFIPIIIIMYIYNWYFSITPIIPLCTRQNIGYIHSISPCSPLLPFDPLSTYLEPSFCGRIRPPHSQAARKLTPLSPHLAHVPSHPKSRPPLCFPDPNMHLIRTTLQTQPISSRTLPFCNVANSLFTLLQLGAFDASQSSTVFFPSLHIDQGGRLALPASSVGPPRVLPPEVLHAEAPLFRPLFFGFPCSLGFHHLSDPLTDSLHGRIHPAEW